MKHRHSAKQIVAKLRQTDVELAKGLKVPDVYKQIGVSEQTDYRWRTRHSGIDPQTARQLRDTEEAEREVEEARSGPGVGPPDPLRRRHALGPNSVLR